MSMPFTKTKLLATLATGLALTTLAHAQTMPITQANTAATNSNIANMLSNYSKNQPAVTTPTVANPTINPKITPSLKTVNTKTVNTINAAKSNSNYSNSNYSNSAFANTYKYGANVYQLGRLYYNVGGQLGVGDNNELGLEVMAGFKAIAPIMHSASQRAHLNFINFLNLHQNTKYSKFGLGVGVGYSYDLPDYHVTLLGDLHLGLGLNFIYDKNPNQDQQHSVFGLDVGSYFGARFYNLFEIGLLYTNFSLSRYYASTDLVFTYYF